MTSTIALLRPYADNEALSAAVLHLGALAPYPGTAWNLSPRRSHHARNASSSDHQRLSTIPLSSRHLRAPTHFRLPSDHLVAASLRQMPTVRDLTTLKATSQQRVAVLVADIGEVLASHADA